MVIPMGGDVLVGGEIFLGCHPLSYKLSDFLTKF